MNLKNAMREAVKANLDKDKPAGEKPNKAALAAIKALKAAESEEQEAEAYKLLFDSLKE